MSDRKSYIFVYFTMVSHTLEIVINLSFILSPLIFPFYLIRSPKQSEETHCFCCVSSSPSSSFSLFCPGRVLSNHLTDCSEILGYHRHAYEVVHEAFKIKKKKSGPKTYLGGMQKSAKILSGRVLSCRSTKFSEIWGIWQISIWSMQQGFKGSPGMRWGHASSPSLHKRPNISETVRIHTLKQYIFLFLMIKHIQWHQPGGPLGSTGAMPHPSTSWKAIYLRNYSDPHL